MIFASLAPLDPRKWRIYLWNRTHVTSVARMAARCRSCRQETCAGPYPRRLGRAKRGGDAQIYILYLRLFEHTLVHAYMRYWCFHLLTTPGNILKPHAHVFLFPISVHIRVHIFINTYKICTHIHTNFSTFNLSFYSSTHSTYIYLEVNSCLNIYENEFKTCDV